MNAVVKKETDAAAVVLSPLESMVALAARDKTIDIKRMDELLAMKDRGPFNDAMSAVQAALSPIAKDSHNKHTKSNYASYAAIDVVIRPIYTAHGLSVTFDTEDSPMPEHVRVVAFVSKGYFTRRYHYDSPTDGKGAKGNDVMSKTHARAAGLSYAKRYLVGLIFNLSTEDDRDGNGQTLSGEMVSADQLKALRSLLKTVKSKDAEVAVCRYFEVETLEALDASLFDRVKSAIEKKIADQKPAQQKAAPNAAEEDIL